MFMKLVLVVGMTCWIGELAHSDCASEQAYVDTQAQPGPACGSSPYLLIGSNYIENGKNYEDKDVFRRNTIQCATGAINYGQWQLYLPSCYPAGRLVITKLNFEQPRRACGSVIDKYTRFLSEQIPIQGVDFSLVYSTRWVSGRVENNRIRINLAPAVGNGTPPLFELKIRDENDVLLESNIFQAWGSYYDYSYEGDQNSPSWSGVLRKIEIFKSPNNYPDYSTIEKVGNFKSKRLGLGAWVPSVWHYLDINRKIVYKGDGTIVNVPFLQTVTTRSAKRTLYRVVESDSALVYYFDDLGRIVQTRLGLTGAIQYQFNYNSYGYLSAIADSFNNVTTFNYDSEGKFSSVIAPNGRTTAVALNSNGYLSVVTNAKNESFNMTYQNEKGLLTLFSKPNSSASTFVYDSEGKLEMDLHSGGYYTAISVSGINTNVLSAMNRKSILTNTKMLSDMVVENETMPDNSIEKTEVSATIFNKYVKTTSVKKTFAPNSRFNGQSKDLTILQINAGSSRTTNYTNSVVMNNASDPFDINTLTSISRVGAGPTAIETTSQFTGGNRTWNSSTKLGRTKTTELDYYQRPIASSVGNFTPINFTYSNEYLSQVHQGSRVTSFTYDAGSKLLSSVTNALNQITSFTYDSADRLSTVTLPDNRIMQYVYDFAGRLLRVVPAGKPNHDFVLNTKELVGAYNPPVLDLVNSYSTQYTYNNDKQVTQIARADGQAVNFNYNTTTGQLTSLSTVAGNYNYSYNGDKFVSRITHPNTAVIDFQYTTGVPSAYTYAQPAGYSKGSYSINFNLGKIGNYTVAGQSGSKKISIVYDYDEYPTQIGDMLINYDIPDGKLTATQLSGANDTYAYSSYGEVYGYSATYNSSAVYDYSLTRDDLGRVTQKIENLNGVMTTWGYGYDLSGRLIEVTKNGTIVSSYQYDSNSNRIAGTISGTTTVASYDDQDRMLTYNTKSYTYNRHGEMLSRTNTVTAITENFSYDVFGNLTQVAAPGKTIVYEMDPLQRRFSKKLNGTLQARFIRDQSNRLIGETNGTGALVKTYVYGSKSHVPDYFENNLGEKYRIITDQIGSVRLVIKTSNGQIMQKMEHDEFGRVLQDTNPGFQNFGFAGGEYDKDTGLVHFGARDYDSETGRWLSKDPILFEGGSANLYQYVNSDPVNFIDPSGLDPDVIVITPQPTTTTTTTTTPSTTTTTLPWLRKDWRWHDWIFPPSIPVRQSGGGGRRGSLDKDQQNGGFGMGTSFGSTQYGTGGADLGDLGNSTGGSCYR